MTRIPHTTSPPPPAGSIRVEQHDGDRESLRSLFALAEGFEHPARRLHPRGTCPGRHHGRRCRRPSPARGHRAARDERDQEHGRDALPPAPRHRTWPARRGPQFARREGAAMLQVATATADIGNLRFYQRLGFRMREIERDAFTAASGYPPGDPGRRHRAARPGLARPAARSMIVATDTDLYTRGAATLLASWEEYARGSAGAALERLDAVSAAVFPYEPERSVYNNALLDRDLGPDDRAHGHRGDGGRLRRRGRRPLRRVGARDRPRHARRAQRPRLHRRRDHARDGHGARGHLPDALRAPARATGLARVPPIPREARRPSRPAQRS